MNGRDCDLTGRRVLVIEDESMITMLLEDTLAEIGCEVVAVASRLNDAAEKANSLAFDVAILDINLSGQCSYSIAESLSDRGVPFVFATGYDGASVPDSLRGVPLLQKPYHQDNLARALRAALG